jgi:amino acid permease
MMKRRQITIREKIMGGVGAFLLSIVLIIFRDALPELPQFHFWMILCPVIFSVFLFTYLLSGIIVKEDEEVKEIEYRTDLKSVVIAIFIWFAVMVTTYSFGIEFSHLMNELDGMATILVVTLYMRKKSDIPVI